MDTNLLLNIIRHFFLLAALAAAIRFWPYYKNSSQRYFLYYLTYSVFTELLAYFVKDYFRASNYILYNIYIIISFLFYLYWFQLILKNKRFIYILTAFFAISAGYSIFNEDVLYSFFYVAFTSGVVCIILLTLYYFIKALRSEKIVSFFKDSKFWIVTGLFLFHIGFLPTLLLQKQLNIFDTHYYAVLTFLNVMLYGCYIKAFLCLKKK